MKQRYERLGKFNTQEVFKNYTDQKVRKEFLGFHIKMNSQRYLLFKKKGVKCVKCGIVGKYFWS